MKPVMVWIAAGMLCALPVAAQVAGAANRNYQTEKQRADVARNLTGAKRDKEQAPEALVAAMKLAPGATVGDIGTGVGYMLPYLSAAVGARGKVVAEDIFPDFLDKARASARSKGLTNVEFVQGTENDPHFAANSLDAALMLEVYHHLNYPDKMLAAIRGAMKDGGRLYVVDFHKEPGSDHIRADEEQAIGEVEAGGFRLESKSERPGGRQYMAVFEKK